jgi:MoxR-like ATPase
MALFSQQLKPEDVFTPRAATVNQSMYIDRPQLERSTETALRVKFHIIIHGESGTGKTWLYKKVLADKSVPLHVINMA